MNFTHKGYGRIYCKDAADIGKVKNVILEMDEFEHSYLPPNLIAPFSEYPDVVYLHKFSDLDIDNLIAICWSRGIYIWALDNGHSEYVRDPAEIAKDE